jgi:hypothetical protein
MAIHIRRRELLAAVGGAAVWPLVARAQQPGLPMIGYLSLGSPSPNSLYGGPFLQGLAQAGYVPGRNVVIEFRGAKFQQFCPAEACRRSGRPEGGRDSDHWFTTMLQLRRRPPPRRPRSSS